MNGLGDLKHRLEALEAKVEALVKGVDKVKITVEMPRVIVGRKPVYVKIPEDELDNPPSPGRIPGQVEVCERGGLRTP